MTQLLHRLTIRVDVDRALLDGCDRATAEELSAPVVVVPCYGGVQVSGFGPTAQLWQQPDLLVYYVLLYAELNSARARHWTGAQAQGYKDLAARCRLVADTIYRYRHRLWLDVE